MRDKSGVLRRKHSIFVYKKKENAPLLSFKECIFDKEVDKNGALRKNRPIFVH